VVARTNSASIAEPADVEQLERLLEGTELTPLLCAVAEATGDRALIDPALRPRLQADLIVVPADGGVDADTAARGRRLAARALWRLRREGTRGADIPVGEVIDFLSAGASDHADLLRHELGDRSGPAWTKADLAPDRDLLVGIIGAGPAGLAAAYELVGAGLECVLFERYPDVGGTWLINDYPGCRLDTGHLAYSYSFAQRSDWRHLFTMRQELSRYYRDFADRRGLRGLTRFDSEVTKAVFDEAANVWRLRIVNPVTGAERGATVDVLISAVGFLNQPRVPAFEGAGDFAGQTVHSAQWHPGVDCRGRRVSIIGTGASAYQIAPAIVDDVASLSIFQRNAPWMLPTPTYHDEVSPQARWLFAALPRTTRWLRLWEFWHSTIGKYALTTVDPAWNCAESISEPNHRFRAALVQRITSQYADESLVEAVIPTYPVGAKRMLRDNGVWARTLQRDHVELVTSPIERIDVDGICTADGAEHPSDLIIYATGFDATNFLGTVEVRGRGGVRLSDFWGDEARAYLGVSVPGFPNLFCVGGPNTGLVAIGSQTFMIESAAHYVAESVRYLLERGAATIEPTPQAYRSYADWVEQGNRNMAWGAASVSNWYRNARGTVTVSWPFPLLTYWQITRAVDESAVELGYAPAGTVRTTGTARSTRC